MKKQTLFLIFTLFFSLSIVAQNASQNPAIVNAALAELKKRGLDEKDVRKRLLERGIDIDNVPMADLPRVQKQIEEVIAELEREKEQSELRKKSETVASDTTDVDENTEEEPAPKKKKVVKKKRPNRDETADETDNETMDKEADNETDNDSENKEEKTNETTNQRTEKELKDIKKGGKIVKKAIKKPKRDPLKNQSVEEILAEKDEKNERDSFPKSVIYGQDVFRKGKLTVIKDKDFKAPDSYILNTTDKITVSISGISLYNATLEVKKDGAIEPDRMPKIFVRGLTLGKAKKVIETSFSQFYRFRKEDFDVSVSAARVVTVNIVGEVFRPGSYAISGGNTAFNALVAAGGPTNIGSPRSIQLIRATGEKRRLDVYEFLLDPSVARDFSLFENDYISVPVADRVITVQGAVRRPSKYELIRGENLMKLVNFAGGLSENAVQTTVQVKRFIDDKEKIFDVNYRNLRENSSDFDLFNGDIVIVKTIPKAYENYANIIGAVNLPGDYQITEGMRVADVLKKAELRPEATNFAYLQRVNPNQTMALKFITVDEILKNPASETNYLLQAKDRILVYRQAQFTQKDSLFVSGAVRSELRFPFDPAKSIRISDLVNLAGGLRPDATEFAYVTRRDPQNLKFIEYKRVELRQALERPNSPENIALQPNDELRVQSRTLFVDEASVKVSGAIRQPGEYPWDKTLSLRDVLTLAGGLKLEAASNRVDVFRIQLNGNEEVRTVVATIEVDKNLNSPDDASANFGLQPYDNIVVRSIPEFNFQKMVTVTGEVKYPGPYALTDKNEKLIQVIQRAGGITAEAFPAGATVYRQQDNIGYIVIKLEEAVKNAGSNYNIILKDGDLIEIPKTKDIVTIRGATQSTDLYPEKILAGGKINVAFDGNRSVLYYVDKYAAGVGKDGRKRLISVEHPNGQIERTKDYFFYKSYPTVQKGSIITVGYVEKKKDNDKKERKEIDWSKVVADSVAQATVLLTLIILVQRNL
jgi:protein involved in polysaccharide export with SLBB domain